MIAARVSLAGGFAARLAAKARTLAQAATEDRWRERRNDPARWRRAALLWPLFTKD